MAVVYDWVIEQMEAYPEHNGFENVVFNVHWRVNASEDQHVASSYGSIGIAIQDDSSFTPYESLTKEIVVDWVKENMGLERVSQLESALAGEIENKKHPTVIVKPLPWVANPVPGVGE